ncbi:MAG TPA: HAMP domain-containing histidine kinase [Candidatus Pelethocola excrementipullorum]|nr:HAMP domain-containing histidine kinase [Candidatus Pelethocola excrementipullorum]
MLSRLHIKLTAICCGITGLIALIIILICLSVSRHSMEKQEQAMFLLRANTVTTDLNTSAFNTSVSIGLDWYLRNTDNGTNPLFIETAGRPITLSTLVMSEEELKLIDDVKEYYQNHADIRNADYYTSKISQQYFLYQHGQNHFWVMAAKIPLESGTIDYFYLYRLDELRNNIAFQRFCFLGTWVLSILALWVFSYMFTSHVLKPVISNQKKQKQFVALASHELRSPLAVFKTGLSLLKSNPSEDKAKRFHFLMNEEVMRMERLIDDLLFLSKADQQSLDLKLEPVDMKELLEEIYEKYLPIAEKEMIHLEFNKSKIQKCNCICDRHRIQQTIIILLDNALSYTPSGERITLLISSSKQKYFINIIDTGPGIPDSEKDKIFDRFYQADASHNNKEHIGLGLSIVREICLAHNGAIEVSDTVGGGSTFTIILPLL